MGIFNIMKKIACLLLEVTFVMAIIGCFSVKEKEPTPKKVNKNLPAIRVEGKCFMNAYGDTVVFRGVCCSDPVKLIRDGKWDEHYFEEASNFGANVVRFAVHPENINSMGWDSTFAAIDKGVEWAKKHKMYVVMDWHSIGNLKDEKFFKPMYNTTKSETFKFWKEVAIRYRSEPAVALYELFNEPTTKADVDLGTCQWYSWKSLMEELIDTIRTYNPEAICMCAGFNWAYDLTQIAKAPIERKNVAYVCHPYPMKREKPWEEKWEKDFGYVADTYPLFCSEIGYCLKDEKGAHIPVISNDEYGVAITRYLEKKGASFTAWCFDPDWAPVLITDWNYTPSTQGVFFGDYLKRVNNR